MNQKVYLRFRSGIRGMLLLWLSVLLCFTANGIYAQGGPRKGPSRASRYSTLPSGYTQVGSTQLYIKQTSNSIDVIGAYGGYYYSSTYADNGYKVAMQVGANSAVSVDCLNGTTNNGVTFQASVIQQGDLARICYLVTNNNESDVVVSLGTHADVMIGDNDRAPISRRIDTFGQTYGLTMMDGNGAQLCVLFGSGLAGVTAVSDFWFGYYSTNNSAYNMVGNYSGSSNYMQENGNYDSGMGWCWKDRTIAAGSAVTFSYVIGVGEVNLEPNSTFEATPDDPEAWNDLSRPHRLTLNGSYESPAGLDGVIDYAVEDSEEWIALTDTLKSGDDFSGSLVAMFDATKSTHVIRFRTRDLVGNTTLLHPIEYPDVSFHPLSGIAEKTFTGDSIYQTNLTCDLDAAHYVLTAYHNNINAGTASFNIEGVFPYTIGRKTYTFTINPQPLAGQVTLAETSFVYSGLPFTPEWQFSNEGYANLECDKDYTLTWSSNTLPGTATLTVTGKNNYTGTLTAEFSIDKAPLRDDLFTLALPEEDITYDGLGHGAEIAKAEGVGEATITYQRQDEAEPTAEMPTEAGDYTVYLAFADGSLYYGRERTQVGTFSIYQFSADEWAVLQTVLPQLTEMGWSQPWDVSQGMKSVSSLQGLTIERGHVTGLDLAGQNLTGTFPYAILALTQLKQVNLANNHLSGDLGNTADAFAQQNPTLTASLQELNISGNQLSGNLGLFANCFPGLTSLDASNNCLEEVNPAIPATVTTLDISRQTIARVVPLHLASLSAEDLAMTLPSILLYDHQNQTFTTDINLLCTTQDGSWSMRMASQDGEVTIPYVSEQNTYYGESGDILNVAVCDNSGTPQGSTFRISLSFDAGDGNFDGQVDVLDLQANILYALEKYLTRPYNFTAANLWKDTQINIQDIICFVNLLMDAQAGEPEPSASARRTAPSMGTTGDASVSVRDGKLILTTSRPVAAIDLHISGATSIEVAEGLERMGMTFVTRAQADGLHLIAYSMSGAYIPSGTTTIGSFGSNACSVSCAMLSDVGANAITVSSTNLTTGIENISSPATGQQSLYDLQGRRVNTASRKGLYIQNGHIIMK